MVEGQLQQGNATREDATSTPAPPQEEPATAQRFSNAGAVPAVAPFHDNAQPSASERAFGGNNEHAEAPDHGAATHLRVTATGLNVRSSPSARGHDNILGVVHRGDQIDAVGRARQWVQIRYQGREAFVHGAYVEAANQAPEAAAPAPSEPQPQSTHQAVEKAVQHAPEIKQHLPEQKVTQHAPPAESHAPTEAKTADSNAPAANAPPVISQSPAPQQHAPVAAQAPAVEEKKEDKPKAKPHTDKHLLEHEIKVVLQKFEHGKLDIQAAVQQFIAFDQKHSGGEMSDDGRVMLAMLLGMLLAEETARLRKKYETQNHGPTAAPAELAKPPVINGHETPAPANGPAPVFNPPANPKLEDQNIDALAAQIHDPKVEKVMHDLAAVVTVWRNAPRDARHEIIGEARENLVHGIGVVRAGVQGLDGGNEKVAALKVAINHKLEHIAPYHHQSNMRTIETGDYTTCNVTSLAMSLEAIGKNANNYKESKRPIIQKVAARCHSSVDKAANTLHGHGASWPSVAGLRLPDFMQLAAIANRLHSADFSEQEFVTAAQYAASTKTSPHFLATIAADFDATAKEHYMSFGSDRANNALESFSNEQQANAQVLADARNKAEAHPENRELQQAYADKERALGNKVDGNARVDRDLPLESYKAKVIAEIKPLMDAGVGVISGCYHHFTRCYEVNENYIMVQDPGQFHRTERKLLWTEARALRYFWNYIVVQ